MKLTWKMWLYLAVLLLAIISIAPWGYVNKGVEISSIDQNLSQETGLSQGDIIKYVNGDEIKNLEDYSNVINKIFSSEGEKRIEVKTTTKEFVFLSTSIPEIVVKDIEKTKIRTGLELKGGARALVKPEKELTDQEMINLLDLTRQRLNAYGLKDVQIKEASDLSGNKYMLVEIAGATPSDLESLIAQQGKFEAKIGNETAFIGGNKDITSVCKGDARCEGIRECNEITEGYSCRFEFGITLSGDAAKKHASITSNLSESIENPGYLDQKLDLYLDDILVDSLLVSIDLKGKEATDIAISGPGYGVDEQEAYDNAQDNMRKLQSILITGSLPVKLEIEKIDSVSPILGKEFTRNILIAALIALLVVGLSIFIRYRKLKLTLAIICMMLSEMIILLGILALFKSNIDLAGIAGIIASIGTGIDDQIIMVDSAESHKQYSVKERIKRAFFIIFGAYLTVLVAMLPLFTAGAGLLRGFALTTIIGMTVGVLITRPAFADIIRKIEE